MKYEFNIKDVFVIPFSFLFYAQVILYLLSLIVPGQAGDLLLRFSVHYLSDKYYFVKVIGAVGTLILFILWIWMLFDWGTRTFIKKIYKVYWFLILFLTYAFGSIVYYFVVYKFRKGLESEGKNR